jgi:hypothetical protein
MCQRRSLDTLATKKIEDDVKRSDRKKDDDNDVVSRDLCENEKQTFFLFPRECQY